jgi:hypothetical protein
MSRGNDFEDFAWFKEQGMSGEAAAMMVLASKLDVLPELTRAVRFISHGEMQPAGLEGLAMAIAGDGIKDSLTCALREMIEEMREQRER